MQIAPPAPGCCLIRCVLRLAIAAVMLAGAPAAFAEVVVDEEQRSYILDGVSYAELAAQLETHRAMPSDGEPASSHGLTEVGIEARYELHPRVDGRCALANVQVRVELVQTLPVWKPAQAPSDRNFRLRVGQMLLGLHLHEAGHRRHALMAAGSIDRKLAALTAAESCRRARRAAERVVAREMLRLQIDELRYDQYTGRGRKQGAVLQMERDLPRPLPSQRRRHAHAERRP